VFVHFGSLCKSSFTNEVIELELSTYLSLVHSSFLIDVLFLVVLLASPMLARIDF
jgi:hypothetical protein